MIHTLGLAASRNGELTLGVGSWSGVMTACCAVMGCRDSGFCALQLVGAGLGSGRFPVLPGDAMRKYGWHKWSAQLDDAATVSSCHA